MSKPQYEAGENSGRYFYSFIPRQFIEQMLHNGIADAMRHLFEPFFSTKGIGGTGLGLWVVKDLVEKNRYAFGAAYIRNDPDPR